MNNVPKDGSSGPRQFRGADPPAIPRPISRASASFVTPSYAQNSDASAFPSIRQMIPGGPIHPTTIPHPLYRSSPYAAYAYVYPPYAPLPQQQLHPSLNPNAQFGPYRGSQSLFQPPHQNVVYNSGHMNYHAWYPAVGSLLPSDAFLHPMRSSMQPDAMQYTQQQLLHERLLQPGLHYSAHSVSFPSTSSSSSCSSAASQVRQPSSVSNIQAPPKPQQLPMRHSSTLTSVSAIASHPLGHHHQPTTSNLTDSNQAAEEKPSVDDGVPIIDSHSMETLLPVVEGRCDITTATAAVICNILTELRAQNKFSIAGKQSKLYVEYRKNSNPGIYVVRVPLSVVSAVRWRSVRRSDSLFVWILNRRPQHSRVHKLYFLLDPSDQAAEQETSRADGRDSKQKNENRNACAEDDEASETRGSDDPPHDHAKERSGSATGSSTQEKFRLGLLMISDKNAVKAANGKARTTNDKLSGTWEG